MITYKNIIGPRFGQGDWVNFSFEDTELTFRLAVIPNNKHNANQVSPLKDFRKANTSKWDRNDQSRPFIELSSQRWCFEDATTLDDIAQCSLYVSLVEVTEQQANQNILLSPQTFKDLTLSWMDYSFADNEKQALNTSQHGKPEHRYNLKTINKQHLHWVSALVRFVPEAAPCPIAVIPINSQFVLIASLEIESLHYAGRTNPYSNETLKQFEKDLFEDFLSHIKIEYSPQLIEKIQSLKTKTPA